MVPSLMAGENLLSADPGRTGWRAIFYNAHIRSVGRERESHSKRGS